MPLAQGCCCPAFCWGGLEPANESFSFMMGHFPAPWGNELSVGPLEAVLATAVCLVMMMALLGGSRDIFEDVLPEKQKLYFIMMDEILAALLALTYTNDIFTAYVFIEISTIAACAIVMAKDASATLVATMRYLIMSLLGSGLVLIGIVLLYCITGHLLFPSLQQRVLELVATGQYTIPLTVVVGLIVLGLGIKNAPCFLSICGCTGPMDRRRPPPVRCVRSGSQRIHYFDDPPVL